MPSSIESWCVFCETSEKRTLRQMTRIPERPKAAISHLSSPCARHPLAVLGSIVRLPLSVRLASRQRNSRRCDDPGHAQNFLVLLVGEQRNDQPHILQQFHFLQRWICAHLRQRHLPGQFFKSAQVRDQVFSVVVMWIGVGISRDFGNRIQRALRGRVIAQYTVAFAHLLQGANRVRLRPGTVPHLLALYEEGVPVILVRVGAEDPVVSFGSRGRHRGFESAAIYTLTFKKRNKM